MALIKLNLNPSKRELRWFGLSILLFFALIGGMVWWRTASLTAPIILWSVGVAMCVVYYAIQPFRRPLYLGFMYAVFPIGWTISHAVLALLYYLLFTPIGLIIRLFGRDPMQRRLDRSAATYWVPHDQDRDAGRYFRQF